MNSQRFSTAVIPVLFGGLAACLSAMTGCTVGPDYQRPELAAPDRWEHEPEQGLIAGEAELARWWQTLGDPVLDELIARATQNNRNLKIAFARINEARAARGVARGQYAPDIDAFSDIRARRLSDQTEPNPAIGREHGFHALGLDASWEIDLWGRIKRGVEAADADLQASVELYRDVKVVLLADVASTYIRIRSLQQRLGYAAENLQRQQDTLQLTQDRFKTKLSPELDVEQAKANLAVTQARIPDLRAQLAGAIHRLATLLGEYPSRLRKELAPHGVIPKTPDAVAVGIPAEVIRQRPDIRSAERQLAAQTARIGVATGDLLPRLSLTGTFALEATEFNQQFNAGASTYGFGPALRWNLFDGGRIRGNIQIQKQRTEQLLLAYEQAVLLAVEEVETAMVAYAREQDLAAALRRAAVATAKSVELVRQRYVNGLADFQNVLDSERGLAELQDRLAFSRGNVVIHLIGLYRALGGGWQASPTAMDDRTDPTPDVIEEND